VIGLLEEGDKRGPSPIYGVVRLAVALYDLLYFSNYEVADLLEELREQMR
jgi:hypothetical protein